MGTEVVPDVGPSRSNCRDCTATCPSGRPSRWSRSRERHTSPWSNGPTEGQVNQLKMMKRQMYGRAGRALLRERECPIMSKLQVRNDLSGRQIPHHQLCERTPFG